MTKRNDTQPGGGIKRRHFLAGAAALAVPAAVGTQAATAATKVTHSARPEGGPIGISLMMWTYKSRGKMVERVEGAAKLGIEAVELVGTIRAKDNSIVAARIKELGLKVADVDAGTEMYGPKSALTKPSERDTLLKNLRKQVEMARLYGTDTLLALSGRDFADIDRATQRKSLVDGLKAMMEIVEGEGLKMIIEPLNGFDHKGYFLVDMYEACDIIREVGSPKLKILFDIYHTQMDRGRLIKQIEDNIDIIGHFHVADCPGRHQPGTGELNYANIYRAIKKTGYKGYIGMEFISQGDPDEAIASMRDMLFTELATA